MIQVEEEQNLVHTDHLVDTVGCQPMTMVQSSMAVHLKSLFLEYYRIIIRGLLSVNFWETNEKGIISVICINGSYKSTGV